MSWAATLLGVGLGLVFAAFVVVLWGTARSRRLRAEAILLAMMAALLVYVNAPIGWIPTPARLGKWLGIIESVRGSKVYLGYVGVALAVAAAGAVVGRATGLVGRVTRMYGPRRPSSGARRRGGNSSRASRP